MDQRNLIDQLTTALKGHPQVGAAFVGGSHGRDEADPFSDVDIYAVVAETQSIQDTFKSLADSATNIAPILYSKILPNARTINCITEDWMRFDITVVTGFELGFLTGGQVKPLFDDLGIADAAKSANSPVRELTADELLDDVNEFIRILGLSVVVKKRNDLVVAQSGTNLMRDILIRTMIYENGPQPRRGVLALKKSVTPAQYAELENLPASEADWSSIEERTQAIAAAFFPRARRLATTLEATWPDEFERKTRMYLFDEIGFEFEDSIF